MIQKNSGQSGGVNLPRKVDSVGGDIVGRDKIVRVPSAAALDGALRPVTEAIGAVPAEVRSEAEAKLGELKQEAIKGKAANDGVIAKLVDGLVELVPGAASAMVSAFATPLLGGIAGPYTTFVLDRLPEDNIRFTVCTPLEIKPKAWFALLVYLQTLKMQTQVDRDAKERLEVAHSRRSTKAVRPIGKGAEIAIVPELPGCRFNPPFTRLLWLEDWHRIEFRLQAQPDLAGFELGKAVSGRVAFYVELVLVGEVPIAVAVERTIAGLQQQRRRAGEQAPQQTQEARKRAEAKARQAIEEQQRDAQRREQDEARRAAEAEAASSEAASSKSLRTPVRPVAKLISDLDAFHDIDAPWCPEIVALPLGEFLMGSLKDEVERSSDEGPQHRVRIDRRCAIGRYPVTFDEYDYFCAETRRTKSDDSGWSRGRRPVIDVSWRDAAAYCAWLANETGQPYRLPSEAEWEYAVRAGTTTRYAFGDAITPKDANYSGSKLGKTTEVGAYPPNAWGLHDMHGNVWEWVEDIYHDSYQGAPTDGSAWTDGEGEDSSCNRVIRGGSWKIDRRRLRSAYRGWNVPRGWNHFNIICLGFRVARTLD